MSSRIIQHETPCAIARVLQAKRFRGSDGKPVLEAQGERKWRRELLRTALRGPAITVSESIQPGRNVAQILFWKKTYTIRRVTRCTY